MTLTIKNREDLELEKEYSRSVISSNFRMLLDNVVNARVRKDGGFYETDRRRIKRLLDYFYSNLIRRVEKEDFMEEEYDLLFRSANTMSAEQFIALTNLIVQPYIDIKVDDFI